MSSVLFPGLWGSASDLILTVDGIVRNKSTASDQLHLLLKKHKPDFNALFVNPVSNLQHLPTSSNIFQHDVMNIIVNSLNIVYNLLTLV